MNAREARAILGALRLAHALQFMRSRHADPALSLRSTAAHVGISPFHLSRLFKSRTGCGFARHVRSIRIDSARHLLTTTTLSVKEVAAAVGYSHSNDLDRNFKAVCGVTPTMYRAVMTARQESSIDGNGSMQSG
jgi:transcriptional regulator GlxA family with amidase domain